MSDDAPLEPVAPEPEPTTTGSGPPVWPEPTATQPLPTQPTPTPSPAGSDATPPGSSSTVAVPKWALLVAGALVIALMGLGIGFGIGYAVAPDDGGSDARASGPERRFGIGPFDGDGSGGGQTIPAPEPERRSGGFLGVVTEASTDPAGARIVRVVDGTPAADADLEVADVITEVDDDAVRSPEQLADAVRAHNPGDEVTITYVRDGDTESARVTLDRRTSLELPTPTTRAPNL